MPFDMNGCFAASEIATIAEQFPVQPLQYLPKTLRIRFEEGMTMLQEAGFEVTVNNITLGPFWQENVLPKQRAMWIGCMHAFVRLP